MIDTINLVLQTKNILIILLTFDLYQKQMPPGVYHHAIHLIHAYENPINRCSPNELLYQGKD
jgi:hypothetical protein